MLKKLVTILLVVLAMNLSLNAVAIGETKEEKEAKLAGKVHASILKLGSGKDARVEVRLKDGKKLKGFVSGITEHSFAVIQEKTNSEIEIPYSAVKQIKGNNLSTKAKIAIGIAIGIGVFVLLAIIGSRVDGD